MKALKRDSASKNANKMRDGVHYVYVIEQIADPAHKDWHKVEAVDQQRDTKQLNAASAA